MFENFKKRFSNEFKALAPPLMRIKVTADINRKSAVWKGGAILSELSMFERRWVTRADYDEFGETVVHRKCF